MENEDKFELIQKSEHSNIQEHLKDSFGIEFLVNELLPVELETLGYRKMSLEELRYVEPLFKIAPQLIVDKINGEALEQAFMAATENSYKCILDPSMHLATIKGSSDVFLGSGLDNITNKVSGQARWLENDAVLSISNVPNIALNAFNALSVVTGQYFMAQVNAKLSVIKNGIDDIKQYIDAVKQSELEAALQELNEIIRHLQFIKKDTERTRGTIVQIEDVRKVARRNINLYSNQIQKVIKRASKTDSENVITKNTDDLRQYMIQYRYAVYVYNLAQILKIYLNDITDVEELSMFLNEISLTVNSYKDQYDKMVKWVNRYLEETNSLNKMNIKQMLITAGSGVFVGILSRSFIAGGQTASQVNSLLEDNRKKKKEAYIARNDEYQSQMNDMELINSSISVMDKYIELTGRKTEIVSTEGEYFIKYINDES
ncbi:MAG: hypothetical protein GXY57_03530 [Erysipelotrichaceae bacterium]|nr:hypothetical protein [Erysipelotrichaceae bacterium]